MARAAATTSSRKPAARAPAKLARYRAKRDFSITPEPPPARTAASKQLAFVIQEHHASHLHYDFRLELDGVLVSWAVPKGPSLDPKDKRLAMRVEDHPVAYGGFEGTIPPGQYGAGTVIVWDNGTWEPVGDARAGLKAGKLVFRLHGHKLAGLWELVRMVKPSERQDPWLLFKKRDEWARDRADYDVVEALPDSVIAKPRPLAEEAAATGNSGKAASRPHAPAKSTRSRKVEGEPELPGAVRRAQPATLSPQLATLAKSVPSEGDWLFEIKFDGYRLLTRLEHGHAAIFTRGGLDWTSKLAPIAREVEALGLESAWLDGEAVVLDAHGRPRFNALQNALDAARNGTVLYYLFDIPFANGLDLREVPLHARRSLLKRILEAHPGDRIRFSEDFAGDAAHVLQSACGMQLEGVIAKRRDGAYTSARSTDWLKLKCQARQEFVIGGFSDRSDNPAAVGGLALGYHDEHGRLRYAGRVGTGWSSKEATALRKKLAPLVRDRPPFTAGDARALPRPGPRDHWVAPELVAEIEFSEWTPDGSLRHPSYQGLRADKPARAVTREQAKAPPRSEETPAKGARRAHAATKEHST